MRDKLPTILLALGFAVAGSGGTAIGYTLAQRAETPAAPQAAEEDTAASWGKARGQSRGSRAKARGGPRSKVGARTRVASRGRAGRGANAEQRGQGRTWGGLAEGLDITEEQQQAWQAMMETIRTTCVANRLERGDTTFDLMMAAVSEEDATAEALHAQVESSLEAQREASHCVLEQVLTFREQLTPEQRAALSERITTQRKRRQAWMDSWSD